MAHPLQLGATSCCLCRSTARRVEIAEPQTVFMSTMAGILLFFMPRDFYTGFTITTSTKAKTLVKLVIVGDIVHNALDGVVIAAAFLVSIPTGI